MSDISNRNKEIVSIQVPFGYDDRFHMTKDEVKALTKELMNQWISHDNPLASEVLTRMIKFIGDK